jgi:hypothetical protein
LASLNINGISKGIRRRKPVLKQCGDRTLKKNAWLERTVIAGGSQEMELDHLGEITHRQQSYRRRTFQALRQAPQGLIYIHPQAIFHLHQDKQRTTGPWLDHLRWAAFSVIQDPKPTRLPEAATIAVTARGI